MSHNEEITTMTQIPSEARHRVANQLRALVGRVIEKGASSETVATILKPQVHHTYQASKYARIREEGNDTILCAGPRRYPILDGTNKEATDNYGVDASVYNTNAEKHSLSTVFTQAQTPEISHKYNHGEVKHEESVEYTQDLSLLVKRVFEKLPIKYVVNPSESVLRVAKAAGVYEVVLDVRPDEYERQREHLVQSGFKVVRSNPGLAFIGREGTMHAHLCDQWVALCPIPDNRTTYYSERVVTTDIRYDKARYHEFYFTSGYYFLNVLQTSDLLEVQHPSRVIASNDPFHVFSLTVNARDQQVGEKRFITDWPQESELQTPDGVITVREKKGLIYDYLGVERRLEKYPYAVRRGIAISNGYEVCPLTVAGPYYFTIFSVDVIPYSQDSYSYVHDPEFAHVKRKTSPLMGSFWHANSMPGFRPTLRGFVKQTRYYVDQGVYYTETPTASGSIFFPTDVMLQQALECITYQTQYRSPNRTKISVSMINMHRRVRQGAKEMLSPTLFANSSWRHIPSGFLEGWTPISGSFSCGPLNTGANVTLLIMPNLTDIPPRESNILRSSGIVREDAHGKIILRDMFAWTGQVVTWNGTALTFSEHKMDMSFSNEDCVNDVGDSDSYD